MFIASRRHFRWKRVSVSAIGVATVHALLILPLLLSAADKRSLPQREPEPLYLTVFQFSEDSSLTIGFGADGFSNLLLSNLTMPVLPPSAFAEVAETQSLEGAGANRSLYGRYLEQVTARIERSWIRPREPIGAAEFDCWVRIDQDRDGGVRSVELDQCNGDTRWQLSLVAAIERSSPLSAPPNHEIFTNVLFVRFVSTAFVAGAETDAQYEPDLAAATQVATTTDALSQEE